VGLHPPGEEKIGLHPLPPHPYRQVIESPHGGGHPEGTAGGLLWAVAAAEEREEKEPKESRQDSRS
jgi:hypothetical protein